MEKKYNLVYGIRGKLISAVCMLLVAVIMVVSSTYAWFTLSTAPEITGITTTVGANGALEMLLATKNGDEWVYNEGISGAFSWEEKNTYWGNLVDVSNDSYYGIGNLKLYPSALNLSTEDTVNTTSFLMIPEYGSDGRIDMLLANTVTSTYDSSKQNFYVNSGYGVRAIGVASGMTDRQYAFRNAMSDANTFMSEAKNFASQSLTNNGSTLANVAIKKAGGGDADYTAENVASVQAIVDDLLGEGGVIEAIEKAYIKYMHAIGASKLTVDTTDLVYKLVESHFNGAEALYKAATDGSFTVGETYVDLPDSIVSPIMALKATKEKVEKADAMLELLAAKTVDGGTVKWSSGATYTDADGNTDDIGLGDALTLLADMENMDINGYAAKDVKDKMSEIVTAVAGKGLTVTMKTGGGVYADVADHCEDYSVSVTIEEISYGGVTLKEMPANMKTASTVTPAYLQVFRSYLIDEAPESAGSTSALPLTEFYGYIVDLAFKTNASNSSLLLQIDPADRIYEDNVAGTETQGSGSTMTFTRSDAAADLTDDQIKTLMKATRIVFFDPDNGKIYSHARLDVDNAVNLASGTVADINLVKSFDGYKLADGTVYGVDENHNLVTLGSDKLPTSTVAYWYVYDEATQTDKYYKTRTEEQVAIEGSDETETKYTYTEPYEGALVAAHVTVLLGNNDTTLMSLPTNEPAHLSALVYLDGGEIGNEDVSAISETSVTMKMNLQFSSDATLKPMEDGKLHDTGSNESETTDTSTESETTAQG